jgi:hypothetical protein
MNKAFKVVWNTLRRQFVVVNEVQTSKSKASTKSVRLTQVSLAVLAMLSASGSFASIEDTIASSTYGNAITNAEAVYDYTGNKAFADGAISSSWIAIHTAGTDIASYFYAPEISVKANGYFVATESSSKTYLGISSGENPSVAKTVYIGTYSELPQNTNYGTFTGTGGSLLVKASDSITVNTRSADYSYTVYTTGGGVADFQSDTVKISTYGKTWAEAVDTLTGSTTKIQAKTITVSALSDARSYGIDARGGSNIISADADSGTITVKTFDDEAGIKPAYGYAAASRVATTSSNSLTAHAIVLQTKSTTTANGIYSYLGTQTFTSSTLDLTSTASAGSAYGIYGIQSTSTTVNSSDYVNFTVVSEAPSGTGVYAVQLKTGATARIGALNGDSLGNTKKVTISSTGGVANYALYVSDSTSDLKIAASDLNVISSTSVSGGWADAVASLGTLSLFGDKLNITTSGDYARGVAAYSPGTVNMGDASTSLVNVETTGTSEVIGIFSLSSGSNVNIQAKNIVVNSQGTADANKNNIFGIHVQNNTQDETAPEGAAQMHLTSDSADGLIAITSDFLGVSAFSNGQMTIDGNLKVSATNAIYTRGNATININTDETKGRTTVLNGDIVFGTTNTKNGSSDNSGEILNAYVNIRLNGTDSSWTGSSYSAYKIKDPETEEITPYQIRTIGDNDKYFGQITGFKLTLANGAAWNVTDNSFVNTLTLQGGNITLAEGTTVDVGTFTLEGNNTLNLKKGSSISGKTEITGGTTSFADGSDYLSGAVNVENGTIAVSNLANISSEADTTIGKNGTLQALSAQVYEKGYKDVDSEDSGAFTASNFKFSSGSTLALADEHFTLKYVASAKESLGKYTEGAATLTMLGELVPTEESTDSSYVPTIDEIGKADVALPNQDVKVSDTGSDLVIGEAKEEHGNAAELNSNLTVKSLDLGSSGSTLTVNNDKTLVLSGSSEEGTKLVSGGDNLTVNVESGSLQLGTSAAKENNGGSITGSVSLSNSSSTLAVETGSFTVTGGVKAADGSTVSVAKDATLTSDVSVSNAGKTTVSGSLNSQTVSLDSAHLSVSGKADVSETLTAKQGSTVSVEGTLSSKSVKLSETKLEVAGNANVSAKLDADKGSIAVNGTLKANNVALTGTELKVSGNAAVTDTLTAVEGSAIAVHGTLNSKALELDSTVLTVKGAAKVENKLTAENGTIAVEGGKLEADEIALKGTTVTIGNDDSRGELSVKKLALGGGTIFLDPAYSEEASAAYIESLANDTVDGTIAVGQNSKLVIGADSLTPLNDALSAAGLEWGESGIGSAVYIAKSLKIEENGGIVIDSSMTSGTSASVNGLKIASGSALIIPASTGDSVITGSGGTFEVAEGSYLVVENVVAGQTLSIASGFDSYETNGTLVADNRLVALRPTTDDGLHFEAEPDTSSMADSIVPNTLVAVASGAAGDEVGTKRISDLLSITNGLTSAEVSSKINSIALMGTASAAQAVAINSVNMINDTLDRHGSVLASYAHNKTGADLWIDLNGSFSKATRYQAGSSKYGFKSDLAGATIGADYALGNGVALGGAFSFGTGSARGQGNGAGIKNDIEYYGFNLYGAWNTPYVNLIGTVGYTLGKNEIKHLGYKGKPDVNTFSVGIRAEKAHKITENFAVTPHIGIRYMNVDMASFTAGGFKYSAKKVNYAEVPFGVSVNGEAKAQCGAVVKPYADFTLAPALGTKKARNTFGLAGSAASDSFSARVANSNLYQGAIGLEATRANHSLGLSYGIGAGSDGRVDQNLQARYRYSF